MWGRNMAGAGNPAQGIAAGANAARGVIGSNPRPVGARPAVAQGYQARGAIGRGYDPSAGVQASSLGGANLQQYMNPYTNQVIDATMADMGRANNMALNQLGSQASGAGAFGGSRHGVAEAETNRALLDTVGRMSAGLRSDGFNTALQGAQFDIGTDLQSQLANQAATNQARQFGAGAFNNASLANAQATNQARQFGAQAGNNASLANQSATLQANMANQNAGLRANDQRLAAGQQMGQLANLGFGMQRQVNQDMMQQGAMQRAIQQQLINAARQQYQGFTGAPQQALTMPLAALGAAPIPQGQTTTDNGGGILGLLTGVGSFLGAPAGAGTIGSALFCWVAREVYGATDPRWLEFREWVVDHAPRWFFRLYARHGEKIAGVVRRRPWLKRVLRPFMDGRRRSIGFD